MKKIISFSLLIIIFSSNCFSENGYLVKTYKNWKHEELHNFLTDTSAKNIVYLAVSLKLIEEKDVVNFGIWGVIWKYDNKKGKGKQKIIEDIEKQMIWLSSNITTYYFRSNKVDYHNTVKWVAGELEVNKNIIENEKTFVIERAIIEKTFVDIWDKLTKEQRRKLLEDINKNGELTNEQITGIISGSGTIALATLATTVYFTGFAFYTTMSITLSTVAGFFGIALPFAAYTGASTTIGFFTGPPGWIVIGVGAAISIVYSGSANEQKTAAVIMQIHLLKAQALKDSGYSVPTVPIKYRLE